jgi:S1 RNA binding domain protein
MGLLVGDTIEVIVTKITSYGAFVELPDRKRGLIHISEIANTYVKDVNEYLKEKQKVRVKVLTVSNDGRKIDLSMKQADSNEPAPAEKVRPVNVRPINNVRGPVDSSFEDKISRFMKTSEEKLVDLRRNIEAKRGGGRTR